MKHIIIIGAGAAGLMTAATLLEGQNNNIHVHIFEKNTSPGKKVIISGGGRCNITTGNDDKKILETKYTRGWDFIRKSFGKFPPKKVREWFELHGVPIKIEDDLRVFPVSDNGKDVVGVFEKVFKKNCDRVTLHYGEGVSDVSILPDGRYSIKTSMSCLYESDCLVITTGGNAYSHTGSTGDGYAFARALGHSVTELGPSLSSFLTKEEWLHELSGLAFEKARIENLRGPLLLTHFGISGPLAFMTSSQMAWEKIDKGNIKTIHFSPLAEMGFSEWDNWFKSIFIVHPKKTLTTILSEKLPRRFAERFLKECFPHLEGIFVSSLSKIDREKISELLGGGIPITLLERRPGDEFVTAGGVKTDELNGETMESKIHKNLYFAGEVLNVDGYTGGYSLQICWASGYVVGKSIMERI